jgi:hypothetical protein
MRTPASTLEAAPKDAGVDRRIDSAGRPQPRYGFVDKFPGLRIGQGCQSTSKELDLWAYANRVTLDFSRLGRPVDNAYAESFNARIRMECIGQHWFLDLPSGT